MTEPARTLTAPARARDRMRAVIASLANEEVAWDEESVPFVDGTAERCWWIAERLVDGTWRTSLAQVLADRWGCSVSTVQSNYARTAALFTQMVVGDTEGLAELAALRIAKLSQSLDVDPRVQHDASKTLLQLTGHLKGGRETPSMTEAEREAAIVASIREPGEVMTRLLREAFSQPGDGLRALLAEFAVVNTGGEERC